MKKILLSCLLIFAFFLVNDLNEGQKASAALLSDLDVSKGYVIVDRSKTSTRDYLIFVNHDSTKFYVKNIGANLWLMSGGAVTYYKSTDGIDWVKRDTLSLPTSLDNLSETEIKQTNTTVYREDLKTVFFSAPNPYVINSTVEELPRAIMANLMDGGILLVALTVLAVLLAVYWMARYLRSRVH